jgi:pantoate--beta-alanine ligase
MDIVHTAAELSQHLAGFSRVAFVPTMGNLHAGHLSLCRIARQHGDAVVTSIFVNRLQFGPNEDFDRYPRTLVADQAGSSAKASTCSSRRRSRRCIRRRRSIACSRLRSPTSSKARRGPDSFTAVCTVVLKLFHLVQPDIAVFGKKDRQQLKIVRGMVQQFNLPIQIVPAETVRADDGLALSSRNTYLTPAERIEAPNLYRVLRVIADGILSGRHDYANLEAEGRMELAHRGWKVDYIAVRHGLGLRIPHPEGFDHPNLFDRPRRSDARRHAPHRQRRCHHQGRGRLTRCDIDVAASVAVVHLARRRPPRP